MKENKLENIIFGLKEENKKLRKLVEEFEILKQGLAKEIQRLQNLCETRKEIIENQDELLKIKNEKIAELMAEIERLKERNYWLESEHEYECEKSYFEGVKKGRDEGVKDTAKEILDDLRNIFIEQSSYGSDVNQHIGYYDYEVKMGLVIEQIEEYAKEKYSIEYGAEVE